MLPDEVKTPIDYLEYLLTINQISEEMKVKFRSILRPPPQEQIFELWHTLRLMKQQEGQYIFASDDQVKDVIKIFEKCYPLIQLSNNPIIK